MELITSDVQTTPILLKEYDDDRLFTAVEILFRLPPINGSILS